MSEPLQRWWFFHGAAVDPSDVHKYEGMEFGPYVLAAEAEAHEAAAVAEARAEGYEDGCIHGASKYPAIYEQGQRDERNRIGRALEQATYPRGGLLKVEVLNLIYPQDDSRYTTVLAVIDAAPQEPTCLHLREMHVGQSGRINDYGRHSSIVECLNCGVLRLDDETVPPDTPTPHPDDHPAAVPDTEEAEDWGDIIPGQHVDSCRDYGCQGCIEIHECDEFCAAPGGHLNIDGVATDHPATGCVHCQDLAADADDLAREIDREEGR